jgi:hypothetical protein
MYPHQETWNTNLYIYKIPVEMHATDKRNGLLDKSTSVDSEGKK